MVELEDFFFPLSTLEEHKLQISIMLSSAMIAEHEDRQREKVSWKNAEV